MRCFPGIAAARRSKHTLRRSNCTTALCLYRRYPEPCWKTASSQKSHSSPWFPADPESGLWTGNVNFVSKLQQNDIFFEHFIPKIRTRNSIFGVIADSGVHKEPPGFMLAYVLSALFVIWFPKSVMMQAAKHYETELCVCLPYCLLKHKRRDRL